MTIEKFIPTYKLYLFSLVALSFFVLSGKLIASDADKTITRKLKQACELLDIDLLDHLIISKDGYYSFADDGQLKF